MHITEIIAQAASSGKSRFSFELLPPLKGEGTQQIFDTIDSLMEFSPAFCSITSHREDVKYVEKENGLLERHTVRRRPGTVGISAAIMKRYGLTVVPHLICGGQSRYDIEDALIDFDFLDIDNVLALRGDNIRGEHAFKNLPNGLYDYMVQTVIKDELGDSTTYNVSNCISITPFVKLPTVTNLHFVKYENNNGSNLVTVAWDAPENLDPALRFERYNVFITELGMRAAENNEEDGQPTEYTLTFRWSAEHIYVQSQYHYGKVNSDTIYVDLETVGVSEVAQDVADGKVSISASEISVDGVASAMMIYNVGGGLVASYKNVSRADISALRQGVYVALITVDGKNVALKFTK